MKKTKLIEKKIKICEICGQEINEWTQCGECLDMLLEKSNHGIYCDHDGYNAGFNQHYCIKCGNEIIKREG